MPRMGLREANQHFGRLVRILRRGDEVVLVDRGTPLAVVKPIRSRKGVQRAMDRLAAEGRIVAPRRAGSMPPFRPVRVDGGLSGAVADEREERG